MKSLFYWIVSALLIPIFALILIVPGVWVGDLVCFSDKFQCGYGFIAAFVVVTIVLSIVLANSAAKKVVRWHESLSTSPTKRSRWVSVIGFSIVIFLIIFFSWISLQWINY
jgi:hypothetical protein